ncbi:MAG: phosphomethylpyrimidine synthase ThiC [Oscillospiraceae bacterium]|nr:phosphomethylpyrimidine synthase ThiC [Oscillospiraceae bacterium]
MRQYATQMDAARRGLLTTEMEAVLAREPIGKDALLEGIASGTVAVCANKNHKSLIPAAVGAGTRTKVNVNLGVSGDCADLDAELEKAMLAVELKADAIMDLSCFGKTREFRKRLIELSPVMIGTVPMYDAAGYFDADLAAIPSEKFIEVFGVHAADGVDFMTVHAGLNRKTAERLKQNKRLLNIVSRGGSLLFAWMEMTGRENPFYEHFDRVLDIAREYDVTLSLGDACRPGCIDDATDAAQVEELITLGELTRRAWARDVQVMIEGPGHMALNEIAANMLLEKRLCHGAPFYVLGPLVTDVAPGYDHITSAVGGAVAGAAGADFLCYVTPAEHLRLPDLADMKEGLIAARIAAHAADIAKGLPGARDWDRQMSRARADLDWEKMIGLAIDSETARRFRESSPPELEDSCTMCGKMCAVRNMKKILDGQAVTLTQKGE